MIKSFESGLLVGEIGDVLWIRVEGRGTFHISPDLQAVAGRAAVEQKSRVVVDLQNCPLMDSTFMGTLTSIAVASRRAQSAGLLVINTNTRNLELLENLGLDQMFEIDKEGNALPDLRLEAATALREHNSRSRLDKNAHASHVLEAHEALANANPANTDRFRDVVEFLKSKVKRNHGES